MQRQTNHNSYAAQFPRMLRRPRNGNDRFGLSLASGTAPPHLVQAWMAGAERGLAFRDPCQASLGSEGPIVLISDFGTNS